MPLGAGKMKKKAKLEPNFYRPLQTEKLAEIETKRGALAVTVEQLAGKAKISTRTLHNIRKTRRAWPRHIRALVMALRSIEAEQKRDAEMFPKTVAPAKARAK